MSKSYILNFRTNIPYKLTHIINGKTFKLALKYDYPKDRYYFDVYQLENGAFKLKAGSLFLVTGWDMFQQYKYLGIGNMWIIPKTDRYYANIKSGQTQISGILTDIYGSYPNASNIQDNYFMVWEHEE